MFEQQLVVERVCGDIGLQRGELREPGFDTRVGQRDLFHLLARRAPVGVEVEQRDAAGALDACLGFINRRDAREPTSRR